MLQYGATQRLSGAPELLNKPRQAGFPPGDNLRLHQLRALGALDVVSTCTVRACGARARRVRQSPGLHARDLAA